MQFKSIGELTKAFKSLDGAKVTSLLKNSGSLESAAKMLDLVNVKTDKFMLLKDAFPDVKDDAIKTALGIAKVGDEAATSTSKVKNLGNAFVGASKSAKDLFIGAITAHPIIASVTAIVGAIALVSAAVTDAQEKVENAVTSAEKYQQTKSEVQSINSELETIGNQIDELNAKENLSLTDAQELAKLQAQSAELERQLEIKKALAEIEQQQAARDAKVAFNGLSSRNAIDTNGEGFWTNIVDGIESAVAWLNDKTGATEAGLAQTGGLIGFIRGESNTGTPDQILSDRIKAAKEAQKKLKELQDNQTVENYDKIQSQIDTQQQVVDNYATNLQELYSEIESYTSSFYDESTGAVISGFEEEAKRWEAVQKEYLDYFGKSASSKESAINTLFAKKQFSGLENGFIEAAQTGSYAIRQLIDETPGISEALDEAGVSVDEFVQHFMALGNPNALNLKNVKDQITKAYSDVLGDNATLEELRKSDYRGLEMKKLLDGKSEEEITLFYRYVNDGDIDLSDLTLEDIEELFIKINANTTPAQQSLEELTQSANDVVSSINSINSVLSSQGTGTSISIGDFNSDELKDYQTALEYVNGTLQFNTEKVNAITKAKADEAIAVNEANKAQRQSDYLKNAGEIEQLRAKLKTLNEGEEEYINTKTRLDSLLSDNSAIVSECQQYDLLSASIREATSAYQNWLDKQNSTESGDMFDSSMNAIQAIRDVADSESEDYGRVGTNRYKAAVDFIVPDSIDSSDATAVQSYIDSIGKYFDYDENGNRVGMDITQFCNDAVKEGLMNIEVDADGKEFFNLADGIKMEDFADKLKLTSAMVQAFFGEMQEFGGEFSWADEAIQTVGDLGVKAYESAEALRNMDGYSDISIKMDVSDIENVDGKVASLDATIQQMNNLKAKVPVDSSEVQYANDIIQYCVAQKQSLNEPVFMSIDTSQVSSDLAEVISMFQQLQSAKNDYDIQASIGADTSEAQGKIDSLVAQIQEKSPQIKATIGEIDTSNVDTILAGIAEKSAEMWVTLGVNEDAITGYVPENKKATVTYELDSTAVDAYNPRNIRRTVTYTIVTEGEAPKVNGTTHADGTAFSNGSVKVPTDATSIKRIGRALASGSWGVKKSENALVGELGRELIVYGNRYWTVGDDSAEFTHIPKGAIVFNHKQTEEIFKNGYVTSGGGRGKAYAQGTAYVTGGIGVNNANKTVAVSSSSSSTEKSTEKSSTKSTDKNTKAVDKNTKAVEEAKDEFSELIDWAERLISNYERATDAILNRVDDYELYRNQNKQIDAYLDSAQKQVNMLRNSQNMYASKANAVDLSDDYKRKIRNGELSIEEITDEDLKEKIDKYQEYYDKSQELGDKITELNRSMRETKISKLENILDDYDNLISYHETLVSINDSMNELYEIRNNVGNQNVLWNNLDQQKQMKTYYQASVKEMQSQLDKMVADGTIGLHSDTWIEWTNNINEAKKAIIECDIAVEELKQSILEIRYDAFEKMIDDLEHASDMTAALRDLMPTEGFFDENAKITKSGYAQLALMAEELVNAKQRVSNYNAAIEALDEDLKDGNISQAQYNEKLKEYQSAQMDAVKATKAARDAILDMVKEGINKETEAMEKLIQKRKDDLSLQKEYYDFQEKMKDQSTEMNKIRAQINALEGDDSLEAQSKRRKLNSQLQELQKQYDKDIKDREYDVVQDAYDETLDKFKENQEDTLHELETNLEAQNQAIENYLALTKENYRAAYDELLTYGNEYNIKLTEQLTKPWEDAQNAMNTYVQAVGGIEPNVSIETGKIQANDNGSNPTSSNQVGAESTTLKSSNGTWIKQEGKWWYKHDDGSYTKNGWEQIDGKWYKFDEQGYMQSGWQAWGTDSTGNTAWYYLGEPGDGSMKTSEWIKDDNGKYYFVDHTGIMARYGYIKSKNSDLYYWVNNSGEWEPQWDTYTPDLKKYKTYYARGTKRVPHDTMGYMDDTISRNLALGSEILITDQGVLRQFNAGDMVLNDKQTEFLYELSKNPNAYLQNLVKIPKLDGLSMRNESNTTVHFDSLLTVYGDVDKEVFPGVQKMCESSYGYFIERMKKNSIRLR